MKLVSINNALLLKYSDDSEILQKSTRPYVLVIRLKYKGSNYDFAVPIRSIIPASAPTHWGRTLCRENKETKFVLKVF